MKAILQIKIISLAILIIGCTTPDSEVAVIKKKLVGVWELDSTSTVDAALEKRWHSRTIVFAEDQSFTNYWWNHDLTGSYKGKYFVLNNPNRGLKTVTLIPDIDTTDEEIYRRPYESFDIEKIEKDRMVILHETEKVNRNNVSHIWFTERSIYKK